MALKILISGGGTGGHIYPGISLANELKARDKKNDILFVGTERGMEAKIIPREGFKFDTIIAKGIKRQLCFDSFNAIIIFFISLIQSYKILKKYRPDIVIGTGGYVSGSIVLMASILNIPNFIHEQNVIPGITNKFLSHFAYTTFLSFKQSKKYFKHKDRLVFSGNPIHTKNIGGFKDKNYKQFNLNSLKRTILVLGGSKGAASINSSVITGVGLIKHVIKKDWQVLLISGVDDYEKISSIIGNDRNTFCVESYLYDIEKAYNLADLIICRAGATTLAEINAYGIPSVLIPYPFATDNHQELNARVLEEEGAAIVILEKELSGKSLSKILSALLANRTQLETMAEKSKVLGNVDSAKKIIDVIMSKIKNNSVSN
ncbi:MAG: undecaprenyldiphospho-muramoylpentapeptide beta-N-acetylglucosaminyltransferase [Candidatus Caldatribacteriota bacterium]|nr:undecaprenyldiphospho-muramoylpentapeptide beta-N-acetylglucosaminyltransferase [Candidatus Caldatribacteriota bacterium]